VSKIQFLQIIFVVFILTAIGGFIFRLRDYSKFASECDRLTMQILSGYGVEPDDCCNKTEHKIKSFSKNGRFWEKEFQIGEQIQPGKLLRKISQDKDLAKFKISKIEVKKTKEEKKVFIDFYFKNVKIYILVLRQRVIKGKLAIVLDDWGYNRDVFIESLDLPDTITYAILPYLAFSQYIAEKLSEKQMEFILHQPMEPHNLSSDKLERNTILVSMSEAEIRAILKDNFNSLEHLKGMNNHMGSKVTEDTKVTRIILNEVKNNGLYFLDSFVTNKSVCLKIAALDNVPCLKRDVFIDNQADLEVIKKQLLKARDIAEEKGYAIAIGHAKHNTIVALKEIMPQFAKQGIKFVRLSELVYSNAIGL